MSSYNKMMTDIKNIKEQYKDGKNLSQRISIHQKYSVNKEGLGNWLFKQYQFFPGCKVLELGCGTGDLWNGRVKDLPDGVEIIMTDFSKGMVNEAAEKYKAYDFIKTQIADIQDMPFESGCFDIVIANFMLYHVPEIAKALSEVCRVLKPNGIFYAATVGDNHMVEINKWVYEFDNNLDVFNSSSLSFRLQNGVEILSRFFRNVSLHEYYDHLEIDSNQDLVDYICTFKDMTNISNKAVKGLAENLEKKRNENGMFRVTKQSGTFVAIKD